MASSFDQWLSLCQGSQPLGTETLGVSALSSLVDDLWCKKVTSQGSSENSCNLTLIVTTWDRNHLLSGAMHYVAVLDASINHGGELGWYHSRVYEIHATHVCTQGVLHQHVEGRCVLYMHHPAIYNIIDYVIQENAWNYAAVLFREWTCDRQHLRYLLEMSASWSILWPIIKLQMSSIEAPSFS